MHTPPKLPALVWLTAVTLGSAHARADTLLVPSEHPTIQDAMDAAVTGDTILVSPGTYFGTVDFLGKDVHLKSTDGPSATTIDAQGALEAVTFVSAEGPGAILEGFTVTGYVLNGVKLNSSSPKILDNVISGNGTKGVQGSKGILAFSSRDVLITGNTLHSNAGAGIHLSDALDAALSDNHIHDNGREGILVIFGGRNTISGNRIEDSGEQGMWVRRSNQSKILWNTVRRSDQAGIDVDRCFFTVVRDNITADNDKQGLFVDSSPEIEIRDNVIENNGEFPIDVDGIFLGGSSSAVLVGNVVRFSHRSGIGIRNSGSCTVQGNRVTSSGWGGIDIRNSPSAVLRDNLLAGNAEFGISLQGDELRIEGCTLAGNGCGIEFFQNGNADATNVVLWDNERGIEGPGTITVSHSVVQGGFPGLEVLDQDPLFVDPDGPDDDPVTFEDNDYRLRAESPCVDSGSPSSLPCPGLDVGGTPRLLDGDLDGVQRIDMGAHERSNVYLTVAGDATPGGTLVFHTTGKEGLLTILAIGLPAEPSCLPPFGVAHVNLNRTALFHWTPVPSSESVTVPPSFPTPLSLVVQPVVLAPGTANIGNPVPIELR